MGRIRMQSLKTDNYQQGFPHDQARVEPNLRATLVRDRAVRGEEGEDNNASMTRKSGTQYGRDLEK